MLAQVKYEKVVNKTLTVVQNLREFNPIHRFKEPSFVIRKSDVTPPAITVIYEEVTNGPHQLNQY